MECGPYDDKDRCVYHSFGLKLTTIISHFFASLRHYISNEKELLRIKLSPWPLM